MELSPRARALSPSATLALDARAKALAATGRDVVNMAVGEPDFPAPAAVQEAAVAKIRSGDVRYTPAGGVLSLRRTIAEHVSATRSVGVGPEEITVCHSAKHAISTTLFALVQEGDEVLLPLPAWSSYFEEVRIAGARPVLVPPAEGCLPNLEGLAAAVTPRSRAVLLSSPCNPTGHVWSSAEVEALVRLAERHDLWIVSDEIYRRLVYGAPATSPLGVPGGRERTVVVDGASKCFAMTGYRIGYVAAPPAVAASVADFNSQLTGSPNAVSQAALEAALREEPPEVATMVAAYAERRALLLDGLRRLGLSGPEPGGAYYVFPDVSAWLDERGSAGLCEDLLEAEAVAIVPGTAFGVEGHARLGFAVAAERIHEALRRLERFLGARRAPAQRERAASRPLSRPS